MVHVGLQELVNQGEDDAVEYLFHMAVVRLVVNELRSQENAL